MDALYDIAVQVSDGEKRIASLRDQRSQARDELNRVRDLERLQRRLNSDGGADDASLAQARARHDQIDAALRTMLQHVAVLRGLLGNTQKLSLKEVFFEVAQATLAQDTFDAILRSTNQIMNRGK